MASLRDEILADIEEAFEVGLGDIPRPCTYYSIQGINPSYDPDDGSIVRPQSPNFTFNAIFTDILERVQADIPIQKKDRLIIFPSSYILPSLAKINDYVIDENSVEYHVKAVGIDPAGAHYELHIRPFNVA